MIIFYSFNVLKLRYFFVCLKGFIAFTYNDTTYKSWVPDEILSVKYEDGKWSKPYYDCGGGNIWMLTYTVPFFGYKNGSYYFMWVFKIDTKAITDFKISVNKLIYSNLIVVSFIICFFNRYFNVIVSLFINVFSNN